MDLLRLGEAYIGNSLDIDGDMFEAMRLRRFYSDFHPIVWLLRFAPRVVLTRTSHDSRTIASHYDNDPEFFRLFLDTRSICYTHGLFEADDDVLEVAIEQKLATAFESLRVGPGSRVLEVGSGWGAFVKYAASRGVHVTSLTLSQESFDFVQSVIDENTLDAAVFMKHFLDFSSSSSFDAIINMGSTEHIPDYQTSVEQYRRLLKPGGRVYLDAVGAPNARVSSFVSRHVYPGRSTPLVLHRFLAATAGSFDVVSVNNDRHSYFLTVREWARRLEYSEAEIVSRWGLPLFRTFHAFLWGSAAYLFEGRLDAYRIVLQKSH